LKRPVITLTTDFGDHDGFVGVMKGVILGICPDAQLVDLSHAISPQDIREAGFILQRHVWHFPPETVHLAVVDPGVGTARRPIAARIGDQIFVAPDNGLLTHPFIHAETHGWPVTVVHTDNPQYWRTQVSDTFHGRDIFASVAAYLASGVALNTLGEPIQDFIRLDLPQPTQTGSIWHAEVVHIDHFGNILSNLTRGHLGASTVHNVTLGEHAITRWVATFGEAAPGTLVAQFSSHGHLEIAEVNGNAAVRLAAKVGDPLDVAIK
jgi:hypothetical protein